MQRNVALTLLLCVVSVIALCEGSLLIRTCNFDQSNQRTVQQTIINPVEMKIEDMWFEETAAGKSINVTVTVMVAISRSVMIHANSLNNAQINGTSKTIAPPGGQVTIGFRYDWVAGASYDLEVYVTQESGRFVYEQQLFHAVAPS